LALLAAARLNYARPPHVHLNEEQIAQLREGVSQLKKMV
jgi:hypothetical protein